MNKEQIIEEIKNSPFKIDGIPLYEFSKENYKPWIFELTSNKNEIDKSWFPNGERDRVSGDYFGLYPSLPLWRNEFYSIDGIKIEESELEYVNNFCGTGGSLFVFNKKI